MKLAILLGLLAALLVGCGATSEQATCADAVSAYLRGDEDLAPVAERLRSDERFTDVRTETSAQAAERLASWYPDSPPGARDRTAPAVHLAVTAPDRRQQAVEGLNALLRDVGVARRADCAGDAKAQLVQFGDALRCGRTVSVSFARDEDLPPALATAGNDARVQKAVAVTRAAAAERTHQLFRDDPATFAKLRPATPSLDLTVVPTADPIAVGGHLAGLLEGADQAHLPHCVAVPHPVVDAIGD